MEIEHKTCLHNTYSLSFVFFTLEKEEEWQYELTKLRILLPYSVPLHFILFSGLFS
jgi:hypothetical protein